MFKKGKVNKRAGRGPRGQYTKAEEAARVDALLNEESSKGSKGEPVGEGKSRRSITTKQRPITKRVWPLK